MQSWGGTASEGPARFLPVPSTLMMTCERKCSQQLTENEGHREVLEVLQARLGKFVYHALLHSALLFTTLLYSTVLHFRVLSLCSALHSTTLHSTHSARLCSSDDTQSTIHPVWYVRRQDSPPCFDQRIRLHFESQGICRYAVCGSCVKVLFNCSAQRGPMREIDRSSQYNQVHRSRNSHCQPTSVLLDVLVGRVLEIVSLAVSRICLLSQTSFTWLVSCTPYASTRTPHTRRTWRGDPLILFCSKLVPGSFWGSRW